MLAGPRVSWGFLGFTSALVAVFVAQSLSAARLKSPTYDEPAHIAAGLSYALTGEVRANPQHPPLLKELAGLSLRLAGVRLPDGEGTRRMLSGAGGETAVGNALIAGQGPDHVLFWARLPFILIAAGLGFLIAYWGRRVVGDVAALLALALFALDPTLVAHSSWVTMDVGLAAFSTLFVAALWGYVQRPNARRLALCGLALGAALAVKFSAVFLVPIAAALLLAAVRWPPQPAPDDPATFLRPYGQPTPKSASRDAVYRYAAIACALFVMSLIASIVLQALYLSPDGLFHYSSGLGRVNADHDPSYRVFFAGQLRQNVAGYFAWAFLLKEPIANLILLAVGVAVVIRSRRLAPLAKLFLLLPPAVLFAAHTIWADSLGVRYVIPMLPFVYLIGGVGAAWMLRDAPKWVRPLAVALGLWLVTTAVGIYPDHLAYFNESACLSESPRRIGFDGGSACGPAWLDDSNVDWGQGLKQLKAWMDQNAPARRVRLVQFGTFPPEAYGLDAEVVRLADLFEEPRPGLYAVSADSVARVPALGERVRPGAGAWLRQVRPVAIVGHAFYVYDIP
jgi:hypothetical protein